MDIFCNIIYSVCINGSISQIQCTIIFIHFFHLPVSSLVYACTQAHKSTSLIDGEWYYVLIGLPLPASMFGHEWEAAGKGAEE